MTNRNRQTAEFPPLQSPQEKLAAMRGDYEEREASEAEIRSMGGGFAILCGLMLGVATAMLIALINNWPWISATVAALFA